MKKRQNLPPPTKPGYVFDGWYPGTADAEGNVTLASTSYDFDTAVTADITLYAKWIIDTTTTYTVTYDLGTGNSADNITKSVQGGEQAPYLTPPSKTGYVFVGWYTDKAGTQPYDFNTPVTGNITLYAKYIAFKVEVKVDVKINVDIIGTDRAVVSIGDDQKDALAQNIDFKNDVKSDTTLIEIDAIVKNADDEGEINKITEYLTDKKYNCGSNRIDYDVAVQKVIYTNGTAGNPEELHNLKKPIQITFAIPDKWQRGGTISMFRAHTVDNVTTVEELEDKDTSSATFTIESDKFSTYTMIFVPAPGGGITTKYTLHYESNGGTAYEDEQYSSGTKVTLDKVPTRIGYKFTGWYTDKELTQKITSIKMDSDKTIYAGWRASTVPDMLNGDDHFAYVIGCPDGTVKPSANISRAETATIFFRLLQSSVRDNNLTSTNSFKDVKAGEWYNIPVSTMEKLGIVKGRGNNKFDPMAPITRAEFAAICARFDTGVTSGNSNFPDIKGHWAENEIKRAALLGWINGGDCGKFYPDKFITRAEAMAIINRVLCRLPENESDLLHGMNVWPDNKPGTWYYLAVQEATNSHDCVHKGEIYEKWTKMTEDPDWKKYEAR